MATRRKNADEPHGDDVIWLPVYRGAAPPSMREQGPSVPSRQSHIDARAGLAGLGAFGGAMLGRTVYAIVDAMIDNKDWIGAVKDNVFRLKKCHRNEPLDCAVFQVSTAAGALVGSSVATWGTNDTTGAGIGAVLGSMVHPVGAGIGALIGAAIAGSIIEKEAKT